jgi:transposase InsO family protein
MDIAHLPTSRDNYSHLLVFIDVFSGFVILRAIEHESAECVARALLDVIGLIGPPRILQSDQGSSFVNAVINTLTRLTGINHRIASAYHPQTDGKVERAISSTKSLISKMLEGSFDHWPLFLPFVQLSFNNRISSTTGSSPHVLFFGRPMNEFRDYSTEGTPTINLNDWQEHQRRLLSVVYPAIALRAANMAKHRQDEFARLRAATLLPNLTPGTVVTLKDPEFLKGKVRPSHIPKYDGKRYIVVRQTTNGAYILKDSEGNVLDRRVPIDQMKLIRAWRESVDSQGDVYEVERILDHRFDEDDHTTYYLIKWKGYPDPTWEPYANINDRRLITNYFKHRNKNAEQQAQP